MNTRARFQRHTPPTSSFAQRASEDRPHSRLRSASCGGQAALRAPHSPGRSRQAFTLIELLLVLVILGILAAIVVPKFSGRTEQARQTAAKSQIATFGTALDAFEVDTGYYPKGRNGLQDLVIQPREAQNWKGPYLKNDVPMDPWGNAYIYECPGRHNASGYDLMSTGIDGREGGDDDITNWDTGQRKQ